MIWYGVFIPARVGFWNQWSIVVHSPVITGPIVGRMLQNGTFGMGLSLSAHGEPLSTMILPDSPLGSANLKLIIPIEINDYTSPPVKQIAAWTVEIPQTIEVVDAAAPRSAVADHEIALISPGATTKP